MDSYIAMLMALIPLMVATSTGSAKWVGSSEPDWPNAAVFPSTVQRLSMAQLEFSLDLYKTVVVGKNNNASNDVDVENVIMSPYSVMSVLSMLYLGSSGLTSDQLCHALHFDNLSYVEVHRSYKKIVEGFRHGKTQVNLTVANKIFVQEGINVSKVYGEKLLEYYDASLELVDFANNSSFARDLINTWVRVHTRGKISRLLDDPPSSSTKLLLANAIHFQGFWLNKFDRKKTAETSVFRVSPTETMTVPMMVGRLRVSHGHSKALKCGVLELPYVDRRLSMFVLLPDNDRRDGLGDLEARLSTDVIAQLMTDLKEDMVNVRLPRFKVESKLWLKEYLVQMGLTELFVQDKAGLSGLTSDYSDIFVSDVAHRAFVTVTEEGSEAAATSAMDVERIGFVGESYFEADHPFLFFIWDYQINVFLFVGRVTRPSTPT